ncbi:ABC transporter substrate-binding protein [uncultured Alsobacter sp.]|uniref:ABC transporter substrate-binding protein n=1 Tax=uncultured Alsobacter sp. TaxID=1748258 RepID=UPI0025D4B7CB|nr:sugar ABC transporter substrate-binding protein [uncultured Alsobacter sp.]
MTITRRQALGGAAAMATAGLLGQQRALAGITPGKPFAGKEIKVLAVTSTQFTAHAKKVAAFTEQTGIKVTYVYVPFAALRERLTAEMVGGSDDFDLITAMDVWIPPLVDKYLIPLDKELAARKIDLNRYPSAFRSAGAFSTGTYGLPVRCHIQLLWYRKDLFDKAGLQPPKTWEELVTSGKALQEANPGVAGVTIPYGRNDGQNLMVWYNFLWGKGGDLFDANMKPIFNSPQGIAAAQDFVDIILKHKIAPPGAGSFNEADANTVFFQGKAAMVPTWWHVYNRLFLPDATIKPDQAGFVPLPSYPGSGPTTYTNQWIYGVNGKSKNRDAAMEFMDYITSADIERQILVDPAENDVVCVHWQNLRDPAVNARFRGMHGIAAKALESTTKSIPNIPEFLPIVDSLASAMSEVVTSGKGVKEALDGAAAQATRIMKRAG